jgi:hypothetical protein
MSVNINKENNSDDNTIRLNPLLDKEISFRVRKIISKSDYDLDDDNEDDDNNDSKSDNENKKIIVDYNIPMRREFIVPKALQPHKEKYTLLDAVNNLEWSSLFDDNKSNDDLDIFLPSEMIKNKHQESKYYCINKFYISYTDIKKYAAELYLAKYENGKWSINIYLSYIQPYIHGVSYLNNDSSLPFIEQIGLIHTYYNKTEWDEYRAFIRIGYNSLLPEFPQ